MADLLDCPFCDGAAKCSKTCISHTMRSDEFAALYLGYIAAQENTTFTVPASLAYYYTEGTDAYLAFFPERNRLIA